MKTNLTIPPIIIVLILVADALYAQNARRSAIVLYSGVERTLYWDMICPHNGLEYNYALTDWLQVSAGVGFARRTSFHVTAQPVYQIVQNIEPNINILCSVAGNYATRNNLRIGLGLLHIATKVDYSPRFEVKDNEILSIQREKYAVGSNAVSLLLQDDFMIYKQFFIGLQVGYNFYIGDNNRKPLSIVATERFNGFTSTVGITTNPLPVLHGLLRLGYKF